MNVLLLQEPVYGGFFINNDFALDVEDVDGNFGQLRDTDSRFVLGLIIGLDWFFGHGGGELVLCFLYAVAEGLEYEEAVGSDDDFFGGEACV